jgi:hypothetical protein
MLAPFLTGATDEQAVQIDKIRQAWEQRQQQTPFATFVWTETRVIPRGGLNGPFHKSADEDRPAEDVVITIPDVRCLLGPRGRIRFETEDLDSRLSAPEQKPSQSAFDGSRATTFIPPRSEPFGSGIIDETYGDKSSLSLRPLVLLYRAMDQALIDFELRNFNLLQHAVVVDGVPCVVLKESVGSRFSDLASSLCLDSSRDFIPLRYTEVHVHDAEETVVAQIDISYQEDAEAGFVPATWRASLYSPSGRLLEGASASVIRYEIGKPIPDREFAIAFPPGTKVADKRSGQMYFVKDDGAPRAIAHWGMKPTDDLTGPSQYGFRRIWLPIVNLVVLGVIVAVYFYRKAHSTSR